MIQTKKATHVGLALLLIAGNLINSAHALSITETQAIKLTPRTQREVRLNTRLAPVDPRLTDASRRFWCNYENSDPSRRPILVPYSQWSAHGILRTVRANATAVNGMLRAIYPDEYLAAGQAVREVPYTVPDPVVVEIGDHVVDPGFIGINSGLNSGGSYVIGRHRSTLVNRELKDYQQLVLRPTPAYNTSSLIIAEVHRLGTTTWGPDTLEYIHILNSRPQSTEIELTLRPSSCNPGMLEVQYAMRLNAGRLSGSLSEWTKPRDILSFQCMVLHLLKSVRGRRDFIRRKVFDIFSGTDALAFRDGYLFYDGVYECTTPLGY
jgi:hypothetical protein